MMKRGTVSRRGSSRGWRRILACAAIVAVGGPATAAAATPTLPTTPTHTTTGSRSAASTGASRAPAVARAEGPIPGSPPGDPRSPDIADTYPWLSTSVDLHRAGYVEQEFYVSGAADAYSPTGELLATDVPYRTRIVVRRPTDPHRFNGTVLAEWQNVTAGYDLDALWGHRHIVDEGYAWVGISAQRVGVNQLVGWSPARYGDLDVTGGGQFTADQLSYDIFGQAAAVLRARHGAGADRRGDARPMGRLTGHVDTLLAVGASQSAGRMTIYYDRVLPQVAPVFDGYGLIVGNAPTRVGDEPVFQVLSETDVRSATRPADTDGFRRWEVAGAAHSGWNGQEYRRPLLERDLGAAPTANCANPPFSRVPLHQVVGAAIDRLVRWVERGTPPPTAPPLELAADGTKVRDELGLAQGGIRLSQVVAPIALNTGENSGDSFCRLFGTYVPFDQATLDALYPTHAHYVLAVAQADARNVRAGYLTAADARANLIEAIHSPVGRR